MSPDGKKIVFVRDLKIWTMNIDGTNPLQWVTEQTTPRYPVWSPDSKKIAFSDRSGLYVLDPEKKTVSHLSGAYPSENAQLSWK